MIKLNNGFSIVSDGTQFKLVKFVTRFRTVDGTPYGDEEVVGYYGELSQALKGYIRHTTLDLVRDEQLTLNALKSVLDSLEMEIKRYEL